MSVTTKVITMRARCCIRAEISLEHCVFVKDAGVCNEISIVGTLCERVFEVHKDLRWKPKTKLHDIYYTTCMSAKYKPICLFVFLMISGSA